MKKYAMLLILVLLFVGCNEYNSNMEKMNTTVIERLNENAFKKNLKLDIIEVRSIKYDTVSEVLVDSQRVYRNSKNIAVLYEKLELQNSAMRALLDACKLYKTTGAYDMLSVAVKDIKPTSVKIDSTLAQIKRLEHKDSLICLEIKNKSNYGEVYRNKVFVKAVVKTLNDSVVENISDTIYYYFKKDLQFIDLSNLEQK